MSYKLRTEIGAGNRREISLRAPADDASFRQTEKALQEVLQNRQGMALTRGGAEYFLPLGELLFFETSEGKTAAHTAREMFYTDKRLHELEEILPYNFIRVSKSCILNASRISSIARNITGASAVYFFGTDKKTYVSRSLFKQLRERIDLIRTEGRGK